MDHDSGPPTLRNQLADGVPIPSRHHHALVDEGLHILAWKALDGETWKHVREMLRAQHISADCLGIQPGGGINSISDDVRQE
jgi:hypothetical protein